MPGVSQSALPEPEKPDTLAEWLRWRFDAHVPEWKDLSADDRSYWEHEAAAVRRAVERGGFKEARDGDRPT